MNHHIGGQLLQRDQVVLQRLLEYALALSAWKQAGGTRDCLTPILRKRRIF